MGFLLKSSSSSESGVNLKPESAEEGKYRDFSSSAFDRLRQVIEQGDAASEYSDARTATRGLADMLDQYSRTGGLPTDADVGVGNDLAKRLFGAREVELNQSFEDQETEFARRAGAMGRSALDPVFQAKLRTGFMKQRDMFNAERGAAATQFSLGLPGQRLGYARDRANLLEDVAARSLNNRLTLLGLGNQLREAERSFRLNTSSKYQRDEKTASPIEGIAGLVGAAGTGMSAYSKFSKAFSLPPMPSGGGGDFNPFAGGQGYTPGPWAPSYYGSLPGRR